MSGSRPAGRQATAFSPRPPAGAPARALSAWYEDGTATSISGHTVATSNVETRASQMAELIEEEGEDRR